MAAKSTPDQAATACANGLLPIFRQRNPEVSVSCRNGNVPHALIFEGEVTARGPITGDSGAAHVAAAR